MRGCRLVSFLLLVIVIFGIQGCQKQVKQVYADESVNFILQSSVKTEEMSLEDLTVEPEFIVLAELGGLGEQEKLASPSPSVSGALQVNGTQLCDRYGNPVQLRGISTHGIAWFPDYINETSFSEFRQNWNFNVVRLAMYTAEYGGYCTGGDKEALKELVQKGVEYAVKQDLYVLIDWHILSDGNPLTYKEEAKEFFAEMAARYAECPNVLYEICNEPNGNTSWADIKSYAEEVISVIREKDKNGIIIVGTPNWSQYVDQAAANPITGYENIMYTLHFYAATHTQSLRNTMMEAVNKGLPIFVTEFGICDASGNGAIDSVQAQQWMEAMNDYHISYIAWNLSNKGETSAILNSSCQKKYGFEDADLSDSGKWLYHNLTNQKTPLAAASSTEGKDTGVNSENSAKLNQQEISEEGTSSSVKNNQQEVLAEESNRSSGSNRQETSAEKAGISAMQNSDGFCYKIVPYTSWEADGKSFYQYGVKVKNVSGKDCSSWQIAIPFNQEIALSDGWNGTYSVTHDVLHISAKEYNGCIANGGEVDGIGFIVSGGAGLKPKE